MLLGQELVEVFDLPPELVTQQPFTTAVPFGVPGRVSALHQVEGDHWRPILPHQLMKVAPGRSPVRVVKLEWWNQIMSNANRLALLRALVKSILS